MKLSIKKGLSFGLTSGVITTLGLIVGLNSTIDSKMVILSGIFVIAIADALSDALGVHMAEETANHGTHGEVWEATFYTFLSKFIIAMTFVIPVWFLSIGYAILVSILWSSFLITALSLYIAKDQEIKPFNVVFEHLFVMIIVILITYYVGTLANLIPNLI